MYLVQGHQFASLREVAETYKIPYTTLLHRLDRNISLDQAVTISFAAHKSVTVNGKTFASFASACKEYKVANTTALNRYKKGWTPEQIFGLSPKPKQVRRVDRSTAKCKSITVNNQVYPSYKKAADAHGFPYQKFINRIKKGLTPEQALELEPFPDWFVPGKGQFAVERKKHREREEMRTGKRKCSVCKEAKLLRDFHKAAEGEYTFRCSTCTSKAFLRYRYGITVKEFETLLTRQNKQCAICKTALEISSDGIKRTKNVAVDHCHATGAVRGILCKNCNVGLGFFQDSVLLLNNAANYLKQHHDH
jgi:hypothetical protein